MKILLAEIPAARAAGHEVVDAHECEVALHDADAVILTQCGMCSYSLGVRQPGDAPDTAIHACPGCGTLNRSA
jgi:hypothetical protein